MQVYREGNAQKAARKLVETALKSGTMDNVGVVVVDSAEIAAIQTLRRM